MIKTENSVPIKLSKVGNSEDIIYAEFIPNLKVDLAIAKEIVRERILFTKDERHYLVLDMSNVKVVSQEAKTFMQQPDGGLKNILGAALIASNPVSFFISQVFVKTTANFNTKLFDNKSDAIQWITQYKNSKLDQS